MHFSGSVVHWFKVKKGKAQSIQHVHNIDQWFIGSSDSPFTVRKENLNITPYPFLLFPGSLAHSQMKLITKHAHHLDPGFIASSAISFKEKKENLNTTTYPFLVFPGSLAHSQEKLTTKHPHHLDLWFIVSSAISFKERKENLSNTLSISPVPWFIGS